MSSQCRRLEIASHQTDRQYAQGKEKCSLSGQILVRAACEGPGADMRDDITEASEEDEKRMICGARARVLI